MLRVSLAWFLTDTVNVSCHAMEEVGGNKWKVGKATILNRLWQNNAEKLSK